MVCLSPNRHLFTLAQAGVTQTGACLPLRKLRGAKQVPVYPRADCVASNRRLFTLAQIAWRQTGACLVIQKAEVWCWPSLRYYNPNGDRSRPHRSLMNQPPCGVSPADVVVGGEGGQEVFPDGGLGAADAARLAEIASGEGDAVLHEGDVDDGREVLVVHVVHLAGLVQPLLGVEDDVAAVTVKHLEQDLTRTLPIAVEGEAHPDLVPDIPEALIIVGLRGGEDAAVGDVDDAACALLGVDAVADLEDGELEEADVDDVAAVVARGRPRRRVCE